MGHRLADVHLAGFAPAFTLSLCDSEYARKPPVPIASVVRCNPKKNKDKKSKSDRKSTKQMTEIKNILITGATGNVGFEVIRFLMKNDTTNKIIAGVRNINAAKKLFKDYSTIDFVNFDFEQPETFDNALKNIDTIFLLRPPHISDIEKYFVPLMAKLKEHEVNEVVFLSVQGAEKSKVIPHNKIEKLIENYNLNHIFLRPSYFMQNLTTTLLKDIKNKRQIILPAGKAKFNWIDIENIGEISSIMLNRFSDFSNQTFELTGEQNIDFFEVTDLINTVIKRPISFSNVNPLKFYKS